MEVTRNPSAGDLIRAAIHTEDRRGRTRLRLLLLSILLGGVAFAQKKSAPAPAVKDLTVNTEAITLNVIGQEKDNIACSNKVQPTTGFTECEMLRLSNYLNQMNAVQSEADRQKQPFAAAADDFINKVVTVDRNKGKQYEAPSKQFPLGRLVPIPPPPAPAAPYNPPVGPTVTPAPAPAPAAAPAPKK